MADLIDRQAAIDALDAACVKYNISPHYDDKRSDKEKFFDWWDMYKVLSMKILNNLPSTQPPTSCSEIPNSSTDCISRQAAIDALHMHLMYRMGTDSNKKRLDDWINSLPSAQPEIIRCRNCKFASGDSRICMKFGHSPIGELDFCSFAERREVTT